jgi:hypothetical protein
MIEFNHGPLAAAETGFGSRCHEAGPRESRAFGIVAIIAVGITACVAALGGCSHPAFDCSGSSFHGGCSPGAAGGSAMTSGPVSAPPASPAPAGPPSVSANPSGAAPATVHLGDPSEFADIDDKQCRSYGLTFGSRDYADCRIRLSAQHRGLDPNTGTSAPGSGNR